MEGGGEEQGFGGIAGARRSTLSFALGFFSSQLSVPLSGENDSG